MKYLVPDEFQGGAGWTADNLAKALKAPMAQIGVVVERVSGHSGGGFQVSPGLSPQAYKDKADEVERVFNAVLQRPPPK